MNRIATAATGAIVGGFALLALTACQAGLDGTAAPAGAVALVGQHSAATPITAPISRQSVPARGVAVTSETTGAGGSPAAGTTALPVAELAQTGDSQPGVSAPTIPRTSPSVADQTDPAAGSSTSAAGGSDTPATTPASVPAPAIKSADIHCDYSSADKTYHETLSYEVANATGMALSVDNPGIVGSYGTYDWHGTIEIPNLGCYAINGEQTYTLYTVGGTGAQASRTITRTGTYTVITPPPFSQNTARTPVPTPAAIAAPTSTPGN